MTTTVPADGTFEWRVNPSTRPFIQAARADFCAPTRELDGITRSTQQVFVARGETKTVEPGC